MLLKVALALVFLVLGWVAYQHSALLAARASVDHTVVYINGSYSPAWATWPWQWYLSLVYPQSEVLVYSGYYQYQDTPEARAQLGQALEEVGALLDEAEGARIDIITHSYGALLAHVALQSRPETSARVGAVATMAGPLASDDAFGDQEFLESRRWLGYDEEYRLPGHTALCGRLDSLVSCRRAAYPGHTAESIWSNHLGFILPQLVSGHRVMRVLQ